MRVRAVLAVALVCLTASTMAFGQEEDTKPSPFMLGVGGSFIEGTPAFDAFVQMPITQSLHGRATLTMLFAGFGAYALAVDATVLLQFGLEGFIPYVGGGGGALMVIAPGGQVIGALTVNLVGGGMLPLGDAFGLYGQIRFLGVMTQGFFAGNIAPGVGIYIKL